MFTVHFQIDKSLRQMTDHQLLYAVQSITVKERQLSIQILHHLREVDRRKLYCAQGYPSLFEFCTKALGYSEGAAQRRISSMRLLKTFPELEEKIAGGQLNISQLASAQSFFNREDKSDAALSVDKKKEVLKSIEGKSTRETQQELLNLSSQPMAAKPETMKPIANHMTEVRFCADQELNELLREVRALIFHRNPNPSMAELIKVMAKETLRSIKKRRFGVKADQADQADPCGSKKNSIQPVMKGPPPPPPPAPAVTEIKPKRKHIPLAVRREVYKRDRGSCTFVGEGHHKKCGSKVGIELDHVEPVCRGGASTSGNLRLLCRAHNQWRWSAVGKSV